jgi:hypothetical protein
MKNPIPSLLTIISSFSLSFDIVLISISFLIFPIFRSVSLGAITLFFAKKIFCVKVVRRSNLLIAVTFYTSFIFLALDFYQNQSFKVFINHHLYPVTIHDYLVFIFCFTALKLNPLTPNQIKKILYIFSLSPIILFLTHLQNFSFIDRANMGFENPNCLGLYTTICFPILILLISQQSLDISKFTRIILKILLILSLTLTVMMLLASGSRSSLLIVIFDIILLILYLVNKNKLSNNIILLFLILSTGVILIINNLVNNDNYIVLSRFLDLSNSTSQARVKIYFCFLSLSLEKFLFGWSPQNTAKICETRLNWLTGEVNHAHNFILQISADYGIITSLFIIYFLLTKLIFPIYYYQAKSNYNFDQSFLQYALFLSCLTIILVNLFQSAFYHDPLFPIWLGLFWGSQNNLIDWSSADY